MSTEEKTALKSSFSFKKLIFFCKSGFTDIPMSNPILYGSVKRKQAQEKLKVNRHTVVVQDPYRSWLGGGGGGVNQAYSRPSTTHGHNTDCKLDSVVYAGVCVVIF